MLISYYLGNGCCTTREILEFIHCCLFSGNNIRRGRLHSIQNIGSCISKTFFCWLHKRLDDHTYHHFKEYMTRNELKTFRYLTSNHPSIFDSLQGIYRSRILTGTELRNQMKAGAVKALRKRKLKLAPYTTPLLLSKTGTAKQTAPLS